MFLGPPARLVPDGLALPGWLFDPQYAQARPWGKIGLSHSDERGGSWIRAQSRDV